MFGLGRNVTMALVGWLWADLLLGMFAIFLAANTSSAAVSQPEHQTVDPVAVQIQLPIDGSVLLGSNSTAIDQEEQRIAMFVTDKLVQMKGQRKVAVALAFASHELPTEGDRLAKLATTKLNNGLFAGTVVKTYHELNTGDTGRSLALELYLYY